MCTPGGSSEQSSADEGPAPAVPDALVNNEGHSTQLALKDGVLDFQGPDGRHATYELRPEDVAALRENPHALEHLLDLFEGLQIMIDIGASEPILLCLIMPMFREYMAEVVEVSLAGPVQSAAFALRVLGLSDLGAIFGVPRAPFPL
jgi:hypothetical protein